MERINVQVDESLSFKENKDGYDENKGILQ